MTPSRIPIVANGSLLGAVSVLSTREVSHTEEVVIQTLCRSVFESQHDSEIIQNLDRHTSANRYARTLSHELRNHLQVAWAALDDPENDLDKYQPIADALEQIESTIQEADFIADPSLDPSELEPTSLRTAAEVAWERITTTDGKLNMSIPDSDQVVADPSTLELLFANLFRNGIEHGDGNLLVKTIEDDDIQGFAVTDSGPGIPDHDRERVFEWGFAHGDNSGFGLAIVRQVVESHGWEINPKTGANGGARFEITSVTFA